MAFPATGTLDIFNRANQGPPPGPGWSASNILNTDTGGLQVFNTNCTGVATGWNSNVWNADFGVNQEVYVEHAISFSTAIRVAVRLVNPGTAAVSGYLAETSFSPNRSVLYRIDNGALIQLGTGGSGNASSDQLGLECIGSVISLYIYSSSTGLWTQQVKVFDSTYNQRGKIGLAIKDLSPVEDKFSGGDSPVRPEQVFLPLSVSSQLGS